MARSLTVKHDEVPATSPLFTAFLVLAFTWMLAGAFFGMSSGADAAPSLDAAMLSTNFDAK